MAIKYEDDDPTGDARNRARSSVSSLLTVPDEVDNEHTDGLIPDNLKEIPKYGGSGPTCIGFATKTVSGFMNVVDFVVDILAVVTFLNKKDCVPEDSRPYSNITVNMEELGGRDVNKIDLNYKFYGFLTLCFILIPAFLQSIWSYYIYWVEDKARQEKADCEKIPYHPKFKWYKSFLFHLFPFSIVVSLVIILNATNALNFDSQDMTHTV